MQRRRPDRLLKAVPLVLALGVGACAPSAGFQKLGDNVWRDPFDECRSERAPTAHTASRTLPSTEGEVWLAAVRVAAHAGVISEVLEARRSVAVFDHGFYCQAIKVEALEGQARLTVTGGMISTIQVRDASRTTWTHEERMVEAISQEVMGWTKWRRWLGSPGGGGR
jgi:hypothetical protein